MQIDLEQESQSLQGENIILPLEYTKLLIDDYETSEIVIQDKKNQIYAKSINGHSMLFFKNGDIYEGDILRGMMHGKGVFKWENGVRYEGQFVFNEIEGEGEYFWPDESYYKGQLLHGKRHGQGYYETAGKKTVYTGSWVHGQRSGQGKVEFVSGANYEGEFLNGVKHGKGIFRYQSGNYYEGEFKDDKKVGYGTMHWLDTSEKYFGQWDNNLQNGFGVHIWLENKGEKKMLRNRYEGQWQDGERNGYGVFYYANGSKYEGEWKSNLKEGYAIFTEDTGNVIQGTFKADKLSTNILDQPNLSLNFDELDKTDNLNNSNSVLSPLTKPNTKRNIKEKDKNSPRGPKKSVMGASMTRNSIQLQPPKSQNQIVSLQGTITNIPQDGAKQSTFKPSILTEGISKEERQSTINVINKSILASEQSVNPPTKRSNDKPKEPKQDEKEIQENPYINLLDYSDLDVNFTDVQLTHNNMNTVLLRYNSNLIQLFKECSSKFESQLGENSFSMDMQQMWKFLTEIKIYGESVTQSSIDRLFHKGKKNRFAINAEETDLMSEIEAVKAMGRFVTDEERRDLKLVQFLHAYRKKQKYEKMLVGNILEQDPGQETEDIVYTKVINIHDLSQPLLYRHFVDILIRVAFLRSKIPDQIHLELEKMVEQYIKPWIENKKKSSKSTSKQTDDELAGYLSKVSTIKKSCQHTLENIFNKIKFVSRSSKFGYTDETCYLKDVIKMLQHAEFFKHEADQPFVFSLLESGFDPLLSLAQIDVLSRERDKEREKEISKQNQKRTMAKIVYPRKKTPDFKQMKQERVNKLINYELIFCEFAKILIVYCIRQIKELYPKIDDEVLEKKVHSMLEKINKKTINQHDPRLHKKPAPQKIWPESLKDVLKIDLAKEKMRKVELEKEKKRKEEERKREQRERAQMELNDLNAPSDIEEDSFDDY